MSVTKVATGIQVTFSVINQGPSDFTTVTAVLAYDEAVVSYVSDNPSAGAYVDGAGGGTWTIGTIAAGTTETIEVVLSVDDFASLPTNVTLTVPAEAGESSTTDNTYTKVITEAIALGTPNQGSTSVTTVAAAASPYTLLPGADDVVIIDGSAGDVTINLPDPATFLDSNGDSLKVSFKVFDDNGAGSTITLDSGAGNLIYAASETGAQTLVIAEGASLALVSDGTAYHTIYAG